ncbi:MAG: S41 family peptidase [Alphaproteobacteria bacterium]|nr:S41 family peptidase [Alphaproteobacteria bacterium]
MRKYLISAAVGALLGAGAVGVFTTPIGVMAQAQGNETYRMLSLFGDIFERVRQDYVKPVEDTNLVESAINGMLSSLDPHSAYLNPKNYREMQVQTRGEFGGLGIEVTMENGLVKVVTPMDDTPAARAGLQPGDLVSHLNGEQVLGLSLQEAVDKMRGPVDSDITLTVLRQGREQPFDVTLRRAVIKVVPVRQRAEGNVAYIRITSFSDQADQSVRRAYERLKNEMKDGIVGVVLDLRNNPGGLLDQAVSVSDLFLDQGEIVSTRGRRTDDIQRYSARKGDITEGKPIVVLVNDGSASAAEIVAGALQDHRRATVMGVKSFGKGSVQTVIPFGRQSGAIRLTTALYYTPSGRSIQETGIEPDVTVEPVRPGGQGRPLRSESQLRGHIANPNAPANAAPAPTDARPVAPPPGSSEDSESRAGADPAVDVQLQRAIEHLRGQARLAPKSGN